MNRQRMKEMIYCSFVCWIMTWNMNVTVDTHHWASKFIVWDGWPQTMYCAINLRYVSYNIRSYWKHCSFCALSKPSLIQDNTTRWLSQLREKTGSQQTLRVSQWLSHMTCACMCANTYKHFLHVFKKRKINVCLWCCHENKWQKWKKKIVNSM